MFHYAGDNFHYVVEQFVSCIHFFLYILFLIQPHKQQFKGLEILLAS
jgi:hypothetical protein